MDRPRMTILSGWGESKFMASASVVSGERRLQLRCPLRIGVFGQDALQSGVADGLRPFPRQSAQLFGDLPTVPRPPVIRTFLSMCFERLCPPPAISNGAMSPFSWRKLRTTKLEFCATKLRFGAYPAEKHVKTLLVWRRHNTKFRSVEARFDRNRNRNGAGKIRVALIGATNCTPSRRHGVDF